MACTIRGGKVLDELNQCQLKNVGERTLADCIDKPTLAIG